MTLSTGDNLKVRSRFSEAIIAGEWRRRRRVARLLRKMDRLDPQPAGVTSDRPHRRAVVATVFLLIVLGGAMTASLLGGGGAGPGDAFASRPADAADTRLEPVVKSADSKKFAFLKMQNGDEPVTYDPCAPIHLVVNPRRIVDDGMKILDEALDEVRAVTGLVFVVDGLTDEPPKATQALVTPDGRNWAPVQVAWSDPKESDELAGDIAGYAGSVDVTHGGRRWYVTGSVVLDGPQLTKIQGRDDGRAGVRAVLMHELAHLVGLDHVDSPGQLMRPEDDGSLTSWGRGDRAGLAKLGAGPCINY